MSTAERPFWILSNFVSRICRCFVPSNWAPRWAFYPLTSLAHRCILVMKFAQAAPCPSATPARNLPAGSKPAAAIETGNSKLETRNSKREDRKPRFENRSSDPAGTHRSVGRRYPTLANLRFESHDMYEKTGTYARKTRFAEKCITLITSRLVARLELSQGELKVKAKATML